MNPILALLGLVGLVGVAALAVAAASSGEPMTPDWVRKVLATVAKHEGGGKYDAINANLDGAGLTFGLIQWAQRPGSLGQLVSAMFAADADRFKRTFGPAWQQLLEATARGGLEPVDGAALWTEPWLSRFRAAGRDPVFVEVQVKLATTGEHWRGAEAVARKLGFATERAMAMFFDTAVQQGAVGAMATADRTIRMLTGAGPIDVQHQRLLTEYARQAAAPFYRTTPPATQPKHNVWKLMPDGSWHLWAGKWDLYADITRRRTEILHDRTLRDDPVTL